MTDSKSMQTRFSKKGPNGLLAQLGPNEDSIQGLVLSFSCLKLPRCNWKGWLGQLFLRKAMRRTNQARNRESLITFSAACRSYATSSRDSDSRSMS